MRWVIIAILSAASGMIFYVSAGVGQMPIAGNDRNGTPSTFGSSSPNSIWQPGNSIVTMTPPQFFQLNTPFSPIARIDTDGTVWIDWKAAEWAANGNSAMMNTAIARLMIAIRDHTWKPLPAK